MLPDAPYVQPLLNTPVHVGMAVPGWSAGLQESKELVLDEHVRRRGSSTEGYCVV